MFLPNSTSYAFMNWKQNVYTRLQSVFDADKDGKSWRNFLWLQIRFNVSYETNPILKCKPTPTCVYCSVYSKRSKKINNTRSIDRQHETTILCICIIYLKEHLVFFINKKRKILNFLLISDLIHTWLHIVLLYKKFNKTNL